MKSMRWGSIEAPTDIKCIAIVAYAIYVIAEYNISKSKAWSDHPRRAFKLLVSPTPNSANRCFLSKMLLLSFLKAVLDKPQPAICVSPVIQLPQREVARKSRLADKFKKQ